MVHPYALLTRADCARIRRHKADLLLLLSDCPHPGHHHTIYDAVGWSH